MKSSNITRFTLTAKVASGLLLAALTAASPASAEPVATGAAASKKALEWRTDLPAALIDAAKQNKTVLLRFTANWCGPCRVMDARVWPDQAVQSALAKNYLIVKSDVDDDASQILAQKYGVRGVPTLLLLDAKGGEIARGGFMSAVETVGFLNKASATTHP